MSWVVGRYEGGKAKSVIAHAEAGIGYFILDRGGSSQSPVVTVAFQFVGEGPIPEHLEPVADPFKINKYEKVRKERQGLVERGAK